MARPGRVEWHEIQTWAEQEISKALKSLEASDAQAERMRGRLATLRELLALPEAGLPKDNGKAIQSPFSGFDHAPPNF